MAELLITPSQTIGPFFKDGLLWPDGGNLFPSGAPGRRIRLSGRLFDSQRRAIADALIEFWQPDAAGRFDGRRPGVNAGFGRVQTDAAGRYAITTILPGRVAGADGRLQAPHILVVLFARGLLRQLMTRVYFDGEAANREDPVLELCGMRAATLVAARDPGPSDAYTWNVVLQGANETVFFDA